MIDRIELGDGERLLTLREAAPLLGAPSGEALRCRIRRNPGLYGAIKVGGLWHVRVRNPDTSPKETK